MREIKFRAWTGKKMFSYETLEGFFAHAETNEWPVMQFTGLLDKNGKEIYEGDIISFFDDVAGVEDRGVVRWDDRFTGFTLNARLSNHGKLMVSDAVTGNIHENPELLK